MQQTVYFQYYKFQKGHNSNKTLYKLTTLELDLKYSITKSYANFKFNMSKHVKRKMRKSEFPVF